MQDSEILEARLFALDSLPAAMPPLHRQFAKRGEQFTETVVREVREETGLTVTVGPLIEVRVGDRYRAEVYYEAVLIGGLDGLALQESEILEARLFALDALPAEMPPLHREFAGRGAAP